MFKLLQNWFVYLAVIKTKAKIMKALAMLCLKMVLFLVYLKYLYIISILLMLILGMGDIENFVYDCCEGRISRLLFLLYFY